MKKPFLENLKTLEELPSLPRWKDVVVSLGDRVLDVVTPVEYICKYPKAEGISQSIQRSITEDLDSKIIEALNNKGFVFENQKELHHFGETRCRVLNEPRIKKRTLVVDDSIVICSWYSTVDIDINKDTNNVTINAGFYPWKPKSFIGE